MYLNIRKTLSLGMSESTVAFLEKLSNRTKNGMREETQKRVIHTGTIVKRLVLAMEKILVRSRDMTEMFLQQKRKVSEHGQ